MSDYNWDDETSYESPRDRLKRKMREEAKRIVSEQKAREDFRKKEERELKLKRKQEKAKRMNDEMKKATEVAKKLGNGLKKIGFTGAAVLASIVVLNASTVSLDEGKSTRIMNNATGEYTWHQGRGGYEFVVPFMTDIVEYNTISTVAATDDDDLLDTVSASLPPLSVSFTDNYGGQLEASFRVQLPSSPQKLEAFHQAVKGQTNYNGNTLRTFAKDMLNLTTDQFLARDFMQGGKGAFKQRLKDQADNGMLVTKREKVEIVGQVADSNVGNKNNQTKTAKQFTWKVVTQLDSKGSPLRRPHSLTKYGIEVTQVDLGEFTPNKDLADYVGSIKLREKARAEVVANQQLERDRAVTERLQGERELITKKNKAELDKAQAVVQAEKQVELAKLEAEKETVNAEKAKALAVIDKQRELEIAEANEGIAKADALAAKYQAQAITQKGLAEAQVEKAKYDAIDKEVLISNNNKEVAIAMYRSNIKIEMPEFVNIGGEAANQSSIDQMSTLKLMEQLRPNTASK